LYRAKFKAVTRSPVELPGVVRILSEALRAANCSVLEKPSWILASCSERVIVRAYIQMGRHVGETLGFEGVSVVEVESSNAIDVVKVASIVVGALERAGVGIVLEGG